MNQYRDIIKSEIGDKKIESVIFDIVLRHIKDMVFVMKVEEGPEFQYVFANEPGSDFAGLDESSIGKTLKEVLALDHALPIQRAYETVLEKKSIYKYSDKIALPDGTVMYAESVLTPIKDDHNCIRFIVAVTRDITDLVKEKTQLTIAEQRYRSIVDHNLDGVFTVALDGKILEVNPAAQKLSGYIAKQMTGRSIFNLIPDNDLPKFKELFSNTRMGNALESLDCRLVHSKGYPLITHLRTIPIVVNMEITGIYVIVRDITQQTRSTETIKYMAFHDQLTGLLNRRSLVKDLEELISRYNRTGTFALLSIDLDRFKFLNDTLGHLAGDQLLIKVAERLSEDRSKTCNVYRQGGDEYAILMEGDRKKAESVAQSILAKFAKSFYLNSEEYFISPSIGISMYPNDGNSAELLIKNADEALYRVKERGKAHYQFYRSEMNSILTNVVSLETNLRKALRRNEFLLHYQPQVNLITGTTSSFEALIRWDSKELGRISPGDFIPLAEDTGLIIPIGNWVIDTACKQIREWSERSEDPFKIAINISPKQFQQPVFVDTIRTAIKDYHIDPSYLELEITEGAMQNTAETSPILRGLKDLGVTISIDDFGTGYSSLNYIKQFPIDVLKIDQSFVRDIKRNKKDAAITTTIIHLAKSLGLEVVAEGVEEKEQVDFLLKANCHKGQGFFFSRPISANEVEKNFFR